MRWLNESLARQANVEDQCTGRFREGRFKSQALLDQKALAGCLAYVDLNPIRAAMAPTPEELDYTSIQRRIRHALSGETEKASQPRDLVPFVGNPRQDMPKSLPFRLADYLELVDWAGRALRAGERGAIPTDVPPILERPHIEPQYWLFVATQFESRFRCLVGVTYKLKSACKQLGYQRTPNLAACQELLI